MSLMTCTPWRFRAIDALTSDQLDVLVVGGGIVGSGIARDAAMRGLRVGLVEQYDFAWGTSSRSSRLLHGGIRYLAQGRIGLVRQASVEKCVIQRIAPHLAAPLPFLFPTYTGTPWPLWKLRVGVKLYDLLCSGRNLGASSVLDVGQLRAVVPGLNCAHATGAVRYYDGLTNDARLVIDTLRSAARYGLVLSNYIKLEEAVPDNGGWHCRLHDTLVDRTHVVKARCVVNATGPWAGQFERSQVRIRGTKGIHLVLDRKRLPIDHAVMMTDDRRVVYSIPWGERVYVGTTDTDYTDRLEDVCSHVKDVDYLLTILNRYYPDATIGQGDVLRTWAGVRPLIANARGSPSDVSRGHEIHVATDGWIDVAGGKLTTYRLMAQQTIDRIVSWQGCQASPCRTAHEPLLAESEARDVSGITPPPVCERVVKHACDCEWAVHLDDLMIRRTRWHYYHRDVHELARRVAGWMATCLGWSNEERDKEIRRYDIVRD